MADRTHFHPDFMALSKVPAGRKPDQKELFCFSQEDRHIRMRTEDIVFGQDGSAVLAQ